MFCLFKESSIRGDFGQFSNFGLSKFELIANMAQSTVGMCFHVFDDKGKSDSRQVWALLTTTAHWQGFWWSIFSKTT